MEIHTPGNVQKNTQFEYVDCDNDKKMDKEKVLERTSSLLQTKSFSDVTFIVGPSTSSKKYVGHKVLLAMASPVFEAMFCGDMADKSKVIRVSDISPIGFENLLRYAYTDALNLQSVEDAILTATAAKKYLLPHLLRECFSFIERNVTPQTVCQVLEFANMMEAHHLIYQCLNIIDRQTYHVITSPDFPDVSVSVLETIVHRRHLNLHSEYSLYNAIYMWGKEECKRRFVEPDTDNIRNILSSTLPYIRFLTMTSEEFCKGPAKSGLLSMDECLGVFMNLAIPGIVTMPLGLSTERDKRTSPPEYFTCCLYKPLSYHTPVRPLRVFGVTFKVTNTDVFVVGLGLPIRLDTSYYSVRQPKVEGLLRCTYGLHDDRANKEEINVNFVLSKGKDVKIIFRKPLFVHKGIQYTIEFKPKSPLTEDTIAPIIRDRKQDVKAENVSFQLLPFQSESHPRKVESMEFSDIFFYI
ncbi:BTB/POZ domain-containing protein 6-like isoform X1 [Tachypleus tridentatus]|uniref:BTB/POZ domain-containing protein 6-like isoform X1 n=2 Tax=Tachypleus tridentatus TaxID=6853 RepID=UPI003FD2FF59